MRPLQLICFLLPLAAPMLADKCFERGLLKSMEALLAYDRKLGDWMRLQELQTCKNLLDSEAEVGSEASGGYLKVPVSGWNPWATSDGVYTSTTPHTTLYPPVSRTTPPTTAYTPSSSTHYTVTIISTEPPTTPYTPRTTVTTETTTPTTMHYTTSTTSYTITTETTQPPTTQYTTYHTSTTEPTTHYTQSTTYRSSTTPAANYTQDREAREMNTSGDGSQTEVDSGFLMIPMDSSGKNDTMNSELIVREEYVDGDYADYEAEHAEGGSVEMKKPNIKRRSPSLEIIQEGLVTSIVRKNDN